VKPLAAKVMGVLEWVRNGLVFFPIVVTWLHLSAAAANYQTLLEQGKVPSDTPFLLLWQQGFNGLSGSKFNDVAAQVAYLVIGLIILTLIVHWTKDITSSWSEAKALALRRRVEDLLWRLSQYLATEHRQQQDAMIEALAQMVSHADHLLNEIFAERKGLADSARQREIEFERLSTLNEGLEKSASGLVKYGRRVDQSFHELQAAISNLTMGVEKGSQQQAAVLATVDATGGKTLLALESIQRTNADIEMALREMTGESLRNSRMLQGLSVSLDEVGALAATLREGEASLRQAMNSMRTVSQTLIDNYTEKIDAAYAPVRAAVVQINSALTQFGQTQAQLGKMLEVLSTAGANYKDLTVTVDQHLKIVATSIARSTQRLDESMKQTLVAVGTMERALANQPEIHDR
jgi:chromosome segregation ATPase